MEVNVNKSLIIKLLLRLPVFFSQKARNHIYIQN